MKPHIARTTKRDDYCTPLALFNKIDAVFRFGWDAAASAENKLCERYFSERDASALESAWNTNTAVWCNPPFGNKEPFLEKAIAFRNLNRAVVFLLPNNARESLWWRDLVWRHADEIVTLTPRVNFEIDGKPARGVAFGSCLAIYYPRIPGCEYGPPRESVWRWK